MRAPTSLGGRAQVSVGVRAPPVVRLISSAILWPSFSAHLVIFCFVPFREDISNRPVERQVDFGRGKYTMGVTAVEGEHRA